MRCRSLERRTRRGKAGGRPAPKCLLVDLGGVLIADPRDIVVRGLRPADGIDLRRVSEEYRSLSRRLDADRLTLRRMFGTLQRKFRVRLAWKEFRSLVESKSLVLNRDVSRSLTRLTKHSQVRVVIASNTSRYVWRGLHKKYDIARIFPRPVLSYRIGSLKPSRRFFRVLLRRANCAPKDAYFLDDAGENVAAARSLGIRSRLVTGPGDAARFLRSLERATSSAAARGRRNADSPIPRRPQGRIGT